MSQQHTPHEYGDMGRDYWIRDEGSGRWELITMDLVELNDFLTTVEGFVEREETRDIADVQRKHGNQLDWSESYPWYWQDVISSRLRLSYVVALMSATEWHLRWVCSDVRAICCLPVELDDLKGGTVPRAQKFLMTIAGFSSPSTATWEFVRGTYLLRNVIVHNAGLLAAGGRVRQVRAFIGKSPGIEVDSGLVTIEAEFCRFAHERVERFFTELHGEYAATCRRLAKVLGVSTVDHGFRHG